MGADLLILDGRHLLWRSTSAYGELSIGDGDDEMFTGGIYGFLKLALMTWERLGGSATTVVAWEAPGGPRKRFAIYEAYKRRTGPKASNDEMRNAVIQQEGELRKLLVLLGIRQVQAPGWEADDVIASLCAKFVDAEIAILSGDRDLLQLVSPNVTLFRPMKKGELKAESPETVQEDWGVEPHRILDIKALAGDTSDNIPGVPGIGPKTASKLVQEHGCWQSVVSWAKLNEPTKKWHQSILDHEDNIRLSAQLAELNMRAKLDWTPAKRQPMAAYSRMAQLKFNSLLSGGRHKRLLAMGGGA